MRAARLKTFLRKRAAAIRPRAGSVLIIVLVTLVLTAFALTAFLDKASSDLIVAARDSDARRLRLEAYSALEVTLSVLSSFNQTVGALRSPSEGWGDPLTFANYTPAAGRTVDVSFEDESGKISLPNVDNNTLLAVFDVWQLSPIDAQKLADAILSWMKPNYTPNGTFIPDYDQATLPFAAPGRSLRSYDELATIDVAKDTFYGEDGRPNDLYRRFVDTFSLLNFRQPNINSAHVDVLAALGGFDATQQQNLSDYVNGANAYESKGPSYFRSVRDTATILGQGNASVFGTEISALVIHITVHDGRALYHLNATVTLPGQQAAQTVQPNATAGQSGTSASATANPAQGGASANSAANQNANRNNANAGGNRIGARTPAAGAGGANANGAAANSLKYPFTVLEINENNEPVPTPPPPKPTE
ncbi:MAG TPA: hypothetical protein VG838_00100 [Opitutaceae bacterium]|nr:hypothetical protein [Opitutaceae bacterium]